MSDRGPSAGEVASELRRDELERKLKLLDPKLYEQYSAQLHGERILVGVVACAAALIAVAVLVSKLGPLRTEGAYVVTFMVAAFAFSIAAAITMSIFSRSPEILDNFEQKLFAEEHHRNQGIEAMARKVDEVAAKAAGEKIVLGEGAIYIGGDVKSSDIQTFIQKIQPTEPDVAVAIKTIAGYVSLQNNPEAAEALSNLSDAIARKDKPSKIRAFWNELCRILPEVAKLTESVTAIMKIFA